MSVGVRACQLSLVVSVLLLSSSTGIAATINATSCSSSAVQSAINAASTGDTVVVPAGSCSWGGTTVSIVGKNIMLQGASVTITSTPGATALRIGSEGTGNSSRITGFTLNGGSVIVDGDGWRVDHMTIVSATRGVLGEGVWALGLRPNTPNGPTGLVDHVTFVDTRVLVFGYPDVALNEATLWTSPLGLGDANAMYVEDSTFNFQGQPNVVDCNYSGRFVFRRNIVTDSSIDAHSVQGWNRACRRWEVYDNTIRQVSSPYFTPFFIRGGTGVIFNNTITGTWGEPFISFDNVRSFDNRSEWFPIGQTAPGICNGSSPWDGNASNSGWPCRDQIGRGGDNTLWTAGSPYPIQSSVPAYIWNNTINGAPATVNIRNTPFYGNHIQSGRDYVQNAGAKPAYAPYPYPHPLQGGGVPSAPTNLIVQ